MSGLRRAETLRESCFSGLNVDLVEEAAVREVDALCFLPTAKGGVNGDLFYVGKPFEVLWIGILRQAGSIIVLRDDALCLGVYTVL